MRVKNISARPHHVGDVSIAPGDEKDIPDSFASAINKAELIEIVVKSLLESIGNGDEIPRFDEKPAKKRK
jgi:hypothetical protein